MSMIQKKFPNLAIAKLVQTNKNKKFHSMNQLVQNF